MKRLQIIDLVRSASILVVMGLHFFESTRLPDQADISNGLEDFFSNGRLGVSLFFTISGFLITEIITSGKHDRFRIDFKSFYIKRIGRIYPLVFLMMGVGLWVFLVCDPNSANPKTIFKSPDYNYDFWFWASIPLFFFNLIIALQRGNFGAYWRVLWSLAIEEQFYLAYPWILKFLKRSREVTIFLGFIIALGLVYRTAFTFSYPGKWICFLNSFGYFDQIAMGSVLYFVSSKWKKALSENKFQCAILCSIGFAIMLEAYFNMNLDKPTYLNYGFILGPFFISFGCFLFLLGGLPLTFFEAKFWQVFTVPGQLSFACYLFHWAVLFFLHPVLLKFSPVISFPLFAGATVLLAYCSYVFFERPVNNFIRNFFGAEKSLPLSIPGLSGASNRER